MTELVWDAPGTRLFETGVDHGVLYPTVNGVYQDGVAWSGLTAVTESPSGAEPTKIWADNIPYLNLMSAEEFACTIEAYYYPDEWEECDGSAEVAPGITIGQQARKPFGFSYRSLLGNDTQSTGLGYKIHLVWNGLASPSERSRATVNDTPEAQGLSWEVSTTPVPVPGFQPTAHLTIDSTKTPPAVLAQIESVLYGTAGAEPRLPSPEEIIAMQATPAKTAVPTQPTFVAGTGVITIPTVTGVQYRRTDTNVPVTGSVTISTPGGKLGIRAVPTAGYKFDDVQDDYWSYTRTP